MDLLISDINMPMMDGITLTSKVKKQYPNIKILILSMYEEKYIINKALTAGADGYISKNASKEIILEAIESCMKGERFISPTQDKFTKTSLKLNERKIKQVTLTKREKEILKLIAKEISNGEIAERLDISKRTVETHKKNMILKLGVQNTVGLVKIAIKNDFFSN